MITSPIFLKASSSPVLQSYLSRTVTKPLGVILSRHFSSSSYSHTKASSSHKHPFLTNTDENMAYALSFASPESDFSSPLIFDLLHEREKRLLQNASSSKANNDEMHLSSHVNQRTTMVLNDDTSATVRTQANTSSSSSSSYDHDVISSVLRNHDLHHDSSPIPTTLQDASHPNDPRAIVITESNVPFKIVSVNNAWEQLCGYTSTECHGRTLRLIQGPETSQSTITALMSQLLHGEEGGAVLTNYTKDGRKFQNRLRVGPLRDHNNHVTHFVGVLKEVVEKDEYFVDANTNHAVIG